MEMGRFLTEVANFPRIPPFLGEISISLPGAEKTTVAMLQALIPNQGDGWQWFLNELLKWLAGVADRPAAVSGFQGNAEATPEDLIAAHSTLEAAALLGRRTAEMHLALSSSAESVGIRP